MIRTLDFNPFAAGTVIDDEYEGVTVAATGGSGQAMIFDTANPTGDDDDLASDTLEGLLIISTDGDSSDPDDHDGGGTISFDFDNDVSMKSITFKDIEEVGVTMNFYDRDGNLIESQFVPPTENGGEVTVQLFVPGTATFEVVLPGSGGIDNVTFDDPGFNDDGPTAVDDEAETPEDTPVIVDLLGNDTDPTDQPLTLESVSVLPEIGSVVDNGDGTVTFTPAPDYNGPATISYTVSDPDGNTDDGEALVTVTPVNDAPDAVDDADTTDFNTPITVDLLANDTDVDNDTSDLNVIMATVPADQGTLVNNGDGTVTFTPADGFLGDATISYTIDDPSGATDSAVHVITVSDPSDGSPTAVDDEAETPEDTPVIVDLLGNDTDPTDQPLTLADVSVPPEQGTVTDNGDGTVTFTPAPDYNGPATITYTVEDPDGNTDEGEAVVTVTPVNDAPDAVDDADETDFNTPVTVDLLGNDTDVDNPRDELTVVEATVPADQGSLVDNGDGTVTFTPVDGFTGEATITYTIEDPDGLQDTADHVITVEEPADGSPTAVDDVAETPEDTPVIVDLLGNDTDPTDQPLTIDSVSVPERFGTVEDNGDGTVTFTPAPDFNGDAPITYTVSDPDGNTDTGSATVTVTPVNDAPDAVDDADTTDFNTPVTVDLLANDTDVDNTPDELSVISATVPADEGTLVDNGDGTVTFTPTLGFTGVATITYTIEDPDGLQDTATHEITVETGDLDGIVDGTDDPELIDEDFLGDPDGDIVNDDPAILPGTDPEDDSVRAGGGDDTIETGDGSDTVDGGDGDDEIDTSSGDILPDLGYPFSDTDGLGYDPDSDPENDRDSVDGGAGDDTISTGDDRDTITGGSGADVIDAGIDDDLINAGTEDDRVVGGEGNDTILGGSGDDTIYGGNDPDLGLDVLDIPDEATDDNPFSPDRQPENGRDSIDGGAGNDVIFGQDDDDTIAGGSGNDMIDGGVDDDVLEGNTGEDTLIGGQGDDSASGGFDDDVLDGGEGDDTLRGNVGDDELDGGEGDDSLDGGQGDDTVMGGEGDDSITGNQGDDLLDGGDGNDTMSGGAGQDTFVNVNAGDDVDGGSGPVDFDTLDLTGSAPEGGSLRIEFTSPDREDGIVTYLDEDGNDAGTLVFEEIENIIPCFTPGTKIATPKGERLVEELQVGDRVITRDNGIQEIRWVGQRAMTGAELERAAHLKPVLIRQGALGNDLPERDMMVSPNHRVLVANDKTALYFEEREVLVAAKHLTGLDGVDIVDVSQTTYVHIMFDQHEVILSDGTWTESFQPGDQTLAGIGNAQRQEILELFPELATEEGIEGYASARRSLKKHEAKLVIK